MKLFVCLFLLAAAAHCLPILEDIESEWAKFKQTHARTYRTISEEKLRKSVFTKNYQHITAHNALYAKGEKSYYLNINKYADMTSEETKKLKGYRSSTNDVTVQEFVVDSNSVVPDEIDWRTKGAVTDVKNQGACGSCWAFSAIGALEAQYFFKTGTLQQMSEQNLVDCSKNDGNAGCDGGDMRPAFAYIFANDGIDSETSYPYEHDDKNCRYDPSSNVTSLEGYVTIRQGYEDDLKVAVATQGPITVAIDASSSDFDYYAGGVYYEELCNDGSRDPLEDLDHAVLVVGYGSENGMDYWLVKNSWGTSWGIDGYIKMARNKNNNCGIAAEATYPVMYTK